MPQPSKQSGGIQILDQRTWSEEEYLALSGNRLVEYSEGILEVLAMPTTSHQMIVAYLYGLVLGFVAPRDLGEVLFAPLRVRLWKGKFREPDLVFLLKTHLRRIREKYWLGADLAMEVTSPDEESRYRDLVIKRREYARACIPEYWIVDPQEKRITVLRLAGKRYVVHGEYNPGTIASSSILKGFSVEVDKVFGAGRVSCNGRRRGRE